MGVVVPTEVRAELAVAIERRVQGAVSVVADKCEIGEECCVSGDDDLTVSLNDNACGVIAAVKGRGELPVPIE